MALPTFVIGGAAKAGTTALWAWCSSHPDIWMSPVKEPHFFTRDATNPAPGIRIVGPARDDSYARGIGWYEGLFEGGEDRRARGEASTHYLVAPDGPELMERHAPGLKVIFIFRQPVERAYSHYWHYRRRGWNLPPFSAALADDPRLRYLLHMSRYDQHLERYRRALGDDRLKLLLFDDLRERPEETFRDVCRFIGVDDTVSPDFSREHNPARQPTSHTLQRAITTTRFMGWRFLPDAIRRPARRLRSALEMRNQRPTPSPPLDADTFDALLELFEDDIAAVERVTRPLPEWRQRRGAEPGTDARA